MFTRKQLKETGMTIEKEKRSSNAVTFMILKPSNDPKSNIRAMVRNHRTNPSRFFPMALYKKDEAYKLFDSIR